LGIFATVEKPVDLASIIKHGRQTDGIVAAARQSATIICEIQLRLSAESRYTDESAGDGDFNGIVRLQRFRLLTGLKMRRNLFEPLGGGR
jgi:hypothetical protein